MIMILQDILTWLFEEITIHRNIFPAWYIATGIALALSIILSVIMHFKKFGLLILTCGALMSAIWEIMLFAFGLRDYDNPLAKLIGPIPELIYHSFSEAAAAVLLGLLAIHKLRIINLDKFKDENWSLRQEPESEAVQEGEGGE